MKKCQLPPGHLELFLLSSLNVNQSRATSPSKAKEINLDVQFYREVNLCHIRYCHSRYQVRRGALVDRCANGCICGDDVRIINKSNWMVGVQRIYNYQAVDVPIVTGSTVVSTQ